MFVALIPARGGSKRVKNKNLKLLAGRPLIGYSLDAALKSRHLGEIIVSTDNQDIVDFSREFGITALLRPDELSQDETPMLPVMQHALRSALGRNDVGSKIFVI